jgi:Putative phage abortive infection protein
MSDSDEKEFKVSLKHLVSAAIVIFVLWIAAGVILYHWNPNGNYGTFGDMFGAINALFSGLAFACLIFATFMQREELKLQRKELILARKEAAATRDEIRGQKEQAIAQNRTLDRQTFENTFFHLLAQHVGVLTQMTMSDMGKTKTGRACFSLAFERLFAQYQNVQSNGQVAATAILGTICENLKPSFQQQFGHYFRSLQSLYEFVDHAEIENKKFYSSCITNQLSSPELSIVMYSAMFDHEYAGLKNLIEKYAVLKSLSKYDVVEPTSHVNHFNPSAFA